MIDLANLKDDGYETVRLVDEAGAVVYETQLDLFEANNKLIDIFRANQGKSAVDYYDAVVSWLKEKGFPDVSHRFADNFVQGIFAKVKELKNDPAGAPAPGSPASTESTPSA